MIHATQRSRVLVPDIKIIIYLKYLIFIIIYFILLWYPKASRGLFNRLNKCYSLNVFCYCLTSVCLCACVCLHVCVVFVCVGACECVSLDNF